MLGAYIGSALAKFGNSALDERDRQAELERQRQKELYARGVQENQLARLLNNDAFEMDKYREEQGELARQRGIADTERARVEQDRREFPAKFRSAQSGDEEAKGWVLQRFPQMANALTRQVKSRAAATFVSGGKRMMGSFDQEEGAYYDARGNRVTDATPYEKPESGGSGGTANTAQVQRAQSMVERALTPHEARAAAAQDVLSAYQTSLNGDPAVGDQQMIFAIAKLYDPTSVVREGEQERMVKTGGLPGWVWKQYQYLQGNPNGFFDPKLREGFLRAAVNKASQERNSAMMRMGVEARRQRSSGITAGQIVRDPYEGFFSNYNATFGSSGPSLAGSGRY